MHDVSFLFTSIFCLGILSKPLHKEGESTWRSVVSMGRINRDQSLVLLDDWNWRGRVPERRKLPRKGLPEICIGVLFSLGTDFKLCMCKMSLYDTWQKIAARGCEPTGDSKGSLVLGGSGALKS